MANRKKTVKVEIVKCSNAGSCGFGISCKYAIEKGNCPLGVVV